MTIDPTPAAATPPGEHFLPIALHDLADALVERTAESERAEARGLFDLYVRLFVARQRELRRKLVRSYGHLRPDGDLVDLSEHDDGERRAERDSFLDELEGVLRSANYVPLTPEDIDHALQLQSPYGLEVHVDLADYAVLRLYTRGSDVEEHTHRRWQSAYTRKETSEVPIHRRLFLAIALDDRHLHLKLFRDVPETDLEMLLPNTRVRIRTIDKLRLGVTGGGGAVGGVVSAATKLGAAFNPVTAVIAVGGLGGLIWRQVASVLAQRTKYLAALKGRLYFHNLDNNQGALHHLFEVAGAEECKETLLAYAFLREAPSSAKELDRRVEAWFAERFGVEIDYEVSDGVRKLRESGLLVEDAGGRLSVRPMGHALEGLQRAWIELGLGASADEPRP